MHITDADADANKAVLRQWYKTSDELHKLRVSVARLAQAMQLGHLIPKPTSEATGDEFAINMQEAPYEILLMAAITERGWNSLVGEMVEKIIKGK